MDYSLLEEILKIEFFNQEGGINKNTESIEAFNLNMTRAEASMLIAKYMGYNQTESLLQAPFDDVSIEKWYAAPINYLKKNKIINGKTPQIFEPEEEIIRSEFLKMVIESSMTVNPEIKEEWEETMSKAEPYFKDSMPSDWFFAYTHLALKEELFPWYKINGREFFAPNYTITKIGAVDILIKLEEIL